MPAYLAVVFRIYCLYYPFDSYIAHDLNRTVFYGFTEPRMIPLGNIRIAISIFDHDVIKNLVFTDVTADHHGITRARMRESECLASESGIGGEFIGHDGGSPSQEGKRAIAHPTAVQRNKSSKPVGVSRAPHDWVSADF